jgi:hypothetical protein
MPEGARRDRNQQFEIFAAVERVIQRLVTRRARDRSRRRMDRDVVQRGAASARARQARDVGRNAVRTIEHRAYVRRGR